VGALFYYNSILLPGKLLFSKRQSDTKMMHFPEMSKGHCMLSVLHTRPEHVPLMVQPLSQVAVQGWFQAVASEEEITVVVSLNVWKIRTVVYVCTIGTYVINT
jgi:hypothetical protein